MNAKMLVDLMLEMNIVNVRDIDNEVNKLASRLINPMAQQWFKRVPRFFLTNIERLVKDPCKACKGSGKIDQKRCPECNGTGARGAKVKAEPRKDPTHIKGGGSKYYADPTGGWRKGQAPIEKGMSPLPVREQYDPQDRTYTTQLHKPAAERDIEQSFQRFKPAKAKAKRIFGEPPAKTELEPWMTAPGAEEKEIFHFDPIQTRRRELFMRLERLVLYLNWQSHVLTLKDSQNAAERARAAEADKLFRIMAQMKADDADGFRFLLQDAEHFSEELKHKPWLFTADGKIVAEHGNLTMRKVISKQTAASFGKREVDQNRWPDIKLLHCPEHDRSDCSHPGPRFPIWCIRAEIHGNTYLNQNTQRTPVIGSALYFIDKHDQPHCLAHFPSGQVFNPYDRSDPELQREVAPLFLDANRFPLDELAIGSQVLANEVERLRQTAQ